MKPRNYLGIYTKKERAYEKKKKEVIQAQLDRIHIAIKNASIESYRTNLNNTSANNNTCSKCRSSNLVDKLQGTQVGSTAGDLFLGSGYIRGNTYMNSVIHCNSCGHQWEKKKLNYKTETDIYEDICMYLDRINEDEQYMKRQYILWLVNEIKPYQETIEHIFKKYGEGRSLGRIYKQLFPKYL